jgi:hypothetical protein
MYHFEDFPGIHWRYLKELVNEENFCTLNSFVAVGVRPEGNAPKNGEPTDAFSFTTML